MLLVKLLIHATCFKYSHKTFFRIYLQKPFKYTVKELILEIARMSKELICLVAHHC